MRPSNAPATLSDLKINKTQSSRWQRLAALDEDRFDAKVEAASKRAYDGIARRFIKEKAIERAQRRHSKTIEHGCVVGDLIALADPASGFRRSMPTRRGRGKRGEARAAKSTRIRQPLRHQPAR